MGMLARHKYLLLLIVVAAMLIWSSFAHRLLIRPIVTEALMTAVLIAVFLVVFTNRRERAVAFAIVAMAVAVKWSRYVYLAPAEGSIVQPAAFHVLAAMFLTFAVYVILRNILAEKSVSRDDVLGTVCGYFIAGALWSHVYAVVELAAPGSFVFTPELAKQAATWDGRVAIFHYFSLVTLTTMGYGDVTPLHGPATALAVIEVVFGQFYIAIVVAQLVGIQVVQAMTPKNDGKT